MVYRVYTERKKGVSLQSDALLSEINGFLGISSVTSVRIFNRYDTEGIDRELFEKCIPLVFSEPQTDNVYFSLPESDGITFGVEYLPGQYDQRADSAAQCIQIISLGERPSVKSAKIYQLSGNINEKELHKIKKYLINAVECRECSLDERDTLAFEYEIPADVKSIEGFTRYSDADLSRMLSELALAMDLDDLRFCRDHFESEHRDPTLTEIRMIDTYWSDHCRHTTFNTVIDSVASHDPKVQESYVRYLTIRRLTGRKKPITLMDIATIGAKFLRREGYLNKLDESDEINACTIKVKVQTDNGEEDYLVLFKNETHNHPTEIEPFGGAATCIGGAIRDPLSGRSYVYQAMRVTGAADPLRPLDETIPGKLPQKKLVTTAASGYSSYGNQIGLATGLVDEIYHDGYAAKRLEIGAVIGAAPEANVIRLVPAPGDNIVLLGGRTGRDGCGGATGSSKSHTFKSLEQCGAEVQKGNAPEERKLQRLFRNPEASKMIKRCNDFGAGGVSVAIGELADGLEIDLDAVPKKYEGLDGTELAISESQERMAVVLSPEDTQKFISMANAENLEAAVVAVVTAEPRLKMFWRKKKIVDLPRSFISTNGAPKHIDVFVGAPKGKNKEAFLPFIEQIKHTASDLNVCSKQGLSERFDSTIGAGSILMPFGGKYQLTPSQVIAARIPTADLSHAYTCSVMSYGADPYAMAEDCYQGAYNAVMESVAKLVTSGAKVFSKGENCYFSYQEYFEKLGHDSKKWGKPFAALLGALDAQLELKIASIGGKDSMSGTFENLFVPPTLVSFAVAFADASEIITPEFKQAGHKAVLFTRDMFDSYQDMFCFVEQLISSGKVYSAYVPTYGGTAAAVMKMCFGNGLGFSFNISNPETIFAGKPASIIVETDDKPKHGILLGAVIEKPVISCGSNEIELNELLGLYNSKLESVFPQSVRKASHDAEKISFSATSHLFPAVKYAVPRVVIPVFPGTNCEYDTAHAFEQAGAKAEIFVINNLSAAGITKSASRFSQVIDASQIIFIPGGFSGGDEPDGSGKFITAFFRNKYVCESVMRLLEQRDGLIGGICNGFQALIKLGLVPFGKIIEPDSSFPTLTFNTIGRHVSKLVTTRVASNMSPWYSDYAVDEIHTMPVSHGEGRFVCSDELFSKIKANGQIATQYCTPEGEASMDIRFNPNGSFNAVEGITSPDGRIFGKMGHSERWCENAYKNVPGINDLKLFTCGVKYFK